MAQLRHVPFSVSTTLHQLASRGDTAAVTGLLRAGANHDVRVAHPCFSDGATALHVAAREGHFGVTVALIEAGAQADGSQVEDENRPVNSQLGPRKRDPTPLHEAAARGRVEVVRALLKNGARTDALTLGVKCDGGGSHRRRDYDISPLHLAAERGHVEVVRALVEAEADVNCRSASFELSPLWLAAQEGHTEVVIALLDAGANPNLAMVREEGNGGAPMGWLCAKTHLSSSRNDIERATAMVEALARRGADTTIECCCNNTEVFGPPLSCAVQNGVTSIVAALLDAGADPDDSGVFPVHNAARCGQVDILRLLLRAGANKDARSECEGYATPLHLACRYTHVECVRELLRFGADLWARETEVEEDDSDDDVEDDSDDDDDEEEERVVDVDGCDHNARCGRTPWGVIGLGEQWNYGDVEDPSEDEDEELLTEPSDASPGRDAVDGGREGVRERNDIRRALREEDSWRRRGPLVLLKAHFAKHASASGSFGTGVSDCSSGPGCGGTSEPINDAVMKGTGDGRVKDGLLPKRSRGCGVLQGQEPKQETVSSDLRSAVEGLVGLAAIEEGLFRHVVLTL